MGINEQSKWLHYTRTKRSCCCCIHCISSWAIWWAWWVRTVLVCSIMESRTIRAHQKQDRMAGVVGLLIAPTYYSGIEHLERTKFFYSTELFKALDNEARIHRVYRYNVIIHNIPMSGEAGLVQEQRRHEGTRRLIEWRAWWEKSWKETNLMEDLHGQLILRYLMEGVRALRPQRTFASRRTARTQRTFRPDWTILDLE